MIKFYSLLLLLSIFFACSDKQQRKATGIGNTQVIVKNKQIDTLGQNNFKQFWKEFQMAVKRNDLEAIIKLTNFPIHNLHPCYVRTKGKTILIDSTGMSQEEFRNLAVKIFDKTTCRLTNIMSDSLYMYNKKDDYKNMPLEKLTDQGTIIYEYPAIYDYGKTGGTKSLYFGSIKGQYKLIWIDCEGNISGHVN